MTWGNEIRLPFALAYFGGPTPSSFEFHPGYNTLLNHLWADPMFLLHPHFVTSENPTFWFEVIRALDVHTFLPVFFLEVRSPSDLESMEKRERADMQTRARMAELVGESPLRTMYGVSTMGSTFCFYKYDKDHPELGITPSLRADQIHGRDTTPLEWWNYELFDIEGVGECKMREVVGEVIGACGRFSTLTQFVSDTLHMDSIRSP